MNEGSSPLVQPPPPSLALVSGHKPPMFPDRVMFVHFHLPVLPADAQGTRGTEHANY